MQLSNNFSLAELTHSDVAVRKSLDNEPSQAVVDNLAALCEQLLQPLRDLLGEPVIVTSGYRSQAVNDAVGGSIESYHMDGLAADIVVPGIPAAQVAEIASNGCIGYDKIILEFNRWVHIQLPRREQLARHQTWTARKVEGRTAYSPGLITERKHSRTA